MRAVVVGANGQPGRALRQIFPGAEAPDRTALDVTDRDAVRRHAWTGVDVVLNAAGYTKVDAAEQPEELPAVRAVNVEAVGHLAEVAAELRATLVHVSSEYVFDGTHPGPIPRASSPRP